MEPLGTIWKAKLRDRTFVAELALTILLFVISIKVCSFVTQFIHKRPGVVLPDPILQVIGPYHLTWLTFALIWGGLAIALANLARYPETLLIGFQAAALLMLFRTVTLYLVPLEASPMIIPLADPLVIRLATGELVIKDLFFSGHTSIMFLLCLSARTRFLRRLFLVGTIGVALCVLLQHVHYSADVFVAPFMAYTSWRLTVIAHERFATPQK